MNIPTKVKTVFHALTVAAAVLATAALPGKAGIYATAVLAIINAALHVISHLYPGVDAADGK